MASGDDHGVREDTGARRREVEVISSYHDSQAAGTGDKSNYEYSEAELRVQEHEA